MRGAAARPSYDPEKNHALITLIRKGWGSPSASTMAACWRLPSPALASCCYREASTIFQRTARSLLASSQPSIGSSTD